jgi:DeoR/GlpR family transcriptional regulator of sugar metabolism
LECIKAVRGAGARTVREIASRCNTSPATVSRYMKILRLSGQVEVGGGVLAVLRGFVRFIGLSAGGMLIL